MFRKLCFTLIAFSIYTVAMAQGSKDASILTIDGEDISKSEFERVYKKNNIKETSFDRKSVTDYLNLYINYKLKVKEAFELGMDTSKSFTDELAGYRKQLAQPYLTDKEVTEALLKEAYSRLETDVRASHILVKADPDALPKDSLEAYNKALKIRQDIIGGADFATVAAQKSDDPSAKENGGDLGYFSALQMVYPFETAAYLTKVGDISMPVRTRFGYHIIKVADKRAAQGEIKVAHIMVKFHAGGKPEDSTKAMSKINEVLEKLKGGEDFEELAKQFSEDQGSAKNGGVLPMFGTGRMVPEFEKAAFALKKNGDISEPVRTTYGWHIIKMLERKPLGTFDELQADLKQKISKDSRAELSKSSMIDKIKKKYNFSENLKSLDEFMKVADTTLNTGKWTAERAGKMMNVMFTLDNKKHTQQDFATYVEDHQTRKVTGSPAAMVNQMYNDWTSETCLAYEESKLDVNYPEFKALMQEYRDGILLFELTDKKVWSKAVKDTSGLKVFYDKNKNNYKWGERVDAVVYTAANSDVAKDVHKMMKSISNNDTLMDRINKTSQLNLQVKEGKFSKGDNEIIDSLAWTVGMTKDFKRGSSVVFVNIKQKIPPQVKTIEEARGLITADYQGELEKEWIASLKNKYKVVIHQSVVDSIIK